MDACIQYIEKLRKELPELCDVAKMIEYGIVSSDQSAYNMRAKKRGPPYFKLNGRYFYPKQGIIEYVADGAST